MSAFLPSERDLAQACADARNERDLAAAQMGELAKRAADDVQTLRNALVLDEAKVEAAWAALIDACGLDGYDEYGRPLASPHINCVEIDDMRAALLAAGFTERASAADALAAENAEWNAVFAKHPEKLQRLADEARADAREREA